MLIDLGDYRRCFLGFTITDCVIRSRDIFYFVAVEEYDTEDVPPPDAERLTHVVVYFAKRPAETRWRRFSYKGFSGVLAGVAVHPKEQLVGVDLDGQVIAIGGGTHEIEASIPRDDAGPRRGAVRGLRTLEGELYVCSGNRGLGRRAGRNQWVSLCAGLPVDPDPDTSSLEHGFEDLDGFSAQDVYCVGGRGDVWRFDGQRWERVDFPSNMYLESVCCAGDGSVYIGAQSGSVWKGRGDEWRLIHRGELSLPFKDMVWFQDRVYCTSDYGLWEIVGDEVREAGVPPEIKICSGNLSVADGVMLLAGAFGAAWHDGSRWEQMFSIPAIAAAGGP